MAPGVVSNDDFLLNPGDMYIRDGRWGAIPWLAFVDVAFVSQNAAKPLGWIVAAATGAALATLIGRLFAPTTVTFVGLSLITSLALMSTPNFRWGPAVWYNAVSFFWVTLALLGLLAWYQSGPRRPQAVIGVAVWMVGTAGAAISYQAFAVIPILAWLIYAASRRGSLSVPARIGLAVIPPLGAVVLAAGLISLLNVVAQSSRLEGIGDGEEPLGVSASVILLAYGRPEQVALGWAIVILVAAIIGQIVSSPRGPHSPYRLSSIFSTSVVLVILVALPLLLPEARMGRFASTVQIAVVIGLAAQAAFNMAQKPTAVSESPRQGWVLVGMVGLTAFAGAVLALAGYPVAGATLGVVLGVWAFFLLVVWVGDFPKTAPFFIGLMVLSSLSVSNTMVRDQLVRNWVDVELDTAIASTITLEMSRLDLSKTDIVSVSYSVAGDPSWPSPLLRAVVSGPGVLELYLDSLRDVETEVTRVEGACDDAGDAAGDDLVTVTRVSATEVTVCVNVRESPER
jgi:hypothetical protein